MRITISLLISSLFFLTTVSDSIPYAELEAIPFTSVKIDDSFWSPKLEINHEITVPHVLDWCEKTGRISNFAKAAGLDEGERVYR